MPLPDENADLIAMGPCWACKTVFAFSPVTVISVPIDPQTGLPPDVAPDGSNITPDPAAVARAVRQPLCNNCARRAGHAQSHPLPKESTR